MHIVALEVDRHMHRLHRTSPASLHQNSVARSRHVGHKSGLVKGYEIEGDDDFFFVCLVAKIVEKRTNQITFSLTWVFFFPMGFDLF